MPNEIPELTAEERDALQAAAGIDGHKFDFGACLSAYRKIFPEGSSQLTDDDVRAVYREVLAAQKPLDRWELPQLEPRALKAVKLWLQQEDEENCPDDLLPKNERYKGFVDGGHQTCCAQICLKIWPDLARVPADDCPCQYYRDHSPTVREWAQKVVDAQKPPFEPYAAVWKETDLKDAGTVQKILRQRHQWLHTDDGFVALPEAFIRIANPIEARDILNRLHPDPDLISRKKVLEEIQRRKHVEEAASMLAGWELAHSRMAEYIRSL